MGIFPLLKGMSWYICTKRNWSLKRFSFRRLSCPCGAIEALVPYQSRQRHWWKSGWNLEYVVKKFMKFSGSLIFFKIFHIFPLSTYIIYPHTIIHAQVPQCLSDLHLWRSPVARLISRNLEAGRDWASKNRGKEVKAKRCFTKYSNFLFNRRKDEQGIRTKQKWAERVEWSASQQEYVSQCTRGLAKTALRE